MTGSSATPRIVAVPGPGLDGAECARWGAEFGIEVDVRTGQPVGVLRDGAAGAAGVIVAPGAAGFGDPALAEAISTAGVPVVAVEPGNLRKTGPPPESTGLLTAGARVLYGRGPDTGRHAVQFLARRLGQAPDTLAYGPDPSQVGDLWVPARPAGATALLPVVVLFHGGFWYHAWERDLMDGLAADLAARGLAAWNVEYRRVGAGGGWPATGEDAARATDHLTALAPVYGLDPGRVAVLGHSAGAQLALWVAARGRRGSVHPRLAVGLATIGDLEAALAEGVGGRSVARLLDGAGDPEIALCDASPLARLPIGVPQLLVHAADDAVVPPSQTTRYADAAVAAGDDVTVVELATGGHFDLIDPRTPAWTVVAPVVQNRLIGV
ncbi:MAG TPA: alpha/beta hydrolase [Acidimicrobiia bacterium]|nr:alpha/beta hydrolase [Acidimicrobiia bacterium]